MSAITYGLVNPASSQFAVVQQGTPGFNETITAQNFAVDNNTTGNPQGVFKSDGSFPYIQTNTTLQLGRIDVAPTSSFTPSAVANSDVLTIGGKVTAINTPKALAYVTIAGGVPTLVFGQNIANITKASTGTFLVDFVALTFADTNYGTLVCNYATGIGGSPPQTTGGACGYANISASQSQLSFWTSDNKDLADPQSFFVTYYHV